MSDRELDLDNLVGANGVGRVRFDGEWHTVLPIDGAGYRTAIRLSRRELPPDEALTAMYDLAKRVCPSLSERIDSMSLPQVGALVKFSQQHVEALDKHPKSSRPSAALENELETEA